MSDPVSAVLGTLIAASQGAAALAPELVQGAGVVAGSKVGQAVGTAALVGGANAFASTALGGATKPRGPRPPASVIRGGLAAAERERRRRAGAIGRRATILTGPLGVVGGANVAAKTLTGQ